MPLFELTAQNMSFADVHEKLSETGPDSKPPAPHRHPRVQPPFPPRGGTHRTSDRFFGILQQSAGTGRHASAIDPDPPSPHMSALDSTILFTT